MITFVTKMSGDSTVWRTWFRWGGATLWEWAPMGCDGG